MNYYYVKLSCPKTSDSNHFGSLIHAFSENESIEFDFRNIPNKLDPEKNDSASINDMVFVHIGGDVSNKRKYFETVEIGEYHNGWAFWGVVNDINHTGMTFSANLHPFKRVVSKKDLYFFPQFMDNLGVRTKGEPNQAGLYKLNDDTALSFLGFLSFKEIVDPSEFNNIDFSEYIDPESTARNFAVNEAMEAPKNYLVNEVRKESTNIADELFERFSTWFKLESNYRESYGGLVEPEILKSWNKMFFNNSLLSKANDSKIALIEDVKRLVYDDGNKKWKAFNESCSKGAPKAVLGEKNFLKFLLEEFSEDSIDDELFELDNFKSYLASKNLFFSDDLILRYVGSLLAKPFVILTGLTGSGKTKLAEQFAKYMSFSSDQYLFIAVGADWTNKDSLLGYANSITQTYVAPDSDLPSFLTRVLSNPRKPYFLILDEMNLSLVERYFADFLSAMESESKEIHLHSFSDITSPSTKLHLPDNLFITGTVNIDESTYMFSPKVLDRANTIEFRLNYDDLKAFIKGLDSNEKPKVQGWKMTESFMELRSVKGLPADQLEYLSNALNPIYAQLQLAGSEFGYRSANEIILLFETLGKLKPEMSNEEKLDVALVQKLLPKLHGSASKLKKPLIELAKLTIKGDWNEEFLLIEKKVDAGLLKHHLTFDKIKSMLIRLGQNGFVSFAEA